MKAVSLNGLDVSRIGFLDVSRIGFEEGILVEAEVHRRRRSTGSAPPAQGGA